MTEDRERQWGAMGCDLQRVSRRAERMVERGVIAAFLKVRVQQGMMRACGVVSPPQWRDRGASGEHDWWGLSNTKTKYALRVSY